MKDSLLTLKVNAEYVISDGNITLEFQGKTLHIDKIDNSGPSPKLYGRLVLDGKETKIAIDGNNEKIILPNKMPFQILKKDDQLVMVAYSNQLQIKGSPHSTTLMSIIKNNLKSSLSSLYQVSALEQDENIIDSDKSEGAFRSETAKGFAAACQLYKVFYNEGLSKQDITELDKAYKMFTDLHDLALKSEQMERNLLAAKDEKLLAEYDENKEYMYSKDLTKIVDEIYNQLLTTGEAYINYGLGTRLKDFVSKGARGHHEVMKLKFTGNSANGQGKYSATIYNAGFESNNTDKGRSLLEAKKEYNKANIANKADITRFVKLCHERLIRGSEGMSAPAFKKIDEQVQDYLGPVTSVRQEKGQVRGNCATRSSREALSDVLSPALFDKFYRFVSNKEQIENLLSNVKRQTVAPQPLPNNPLNKVNNLIQLSINNGNMGNLISLLKRPEDVKATYKFNPSGNERGELIHLAIKKNNINLLNKCLELGADGTEKDGSGYTALQMAISLGRLDIANNIIDHNVRNNNVDLLNKVADDGTTALLQAIQYDRIDIINKLIDNGVDLTPAKNKNYVILNLLIEKSHFIKEPNVAKAYTDLTLRLMEDPETNIYLKDGQGNDALKLLEIKIAYDYQNNVPSGPAEEIYTELYHKNIFKGDNWLSDPMQFFQILPKLDVSQYKDAIGKLLDNSSSSKFKEYTELITYTLETQDQAKINYLINIDNPNVNKILGSVLMVILDDKELNSNIKLTKETIELMLKKGTFLKEDMPVLESQLKHIFTPEQLSAKLKQVKLFQSKENNNDEKNNLKQHNAKKKEYNDNLIEKAKQRKAKYESGDISRAIVSFVTGWDLCRDESSYHVLDFTRGLLAYVTSDDSWRRNSNTYQFGDIYRKASGTIGWALGWNTASESNKDKGAKGIS